MLFWILLGVAAGLAALILLISYICFRLSCYAVRKPPTEKYPLPKGEIYEPYRDRMIAWMEETWATPHEDMEITSFDGLKLRGKYYEYAPGAPVELLMHGYRGCADGDMCGAMQRCFMLGRSALIIDQRACGTSEGNVISFGINESKDCRSWVDHMIRRFGPEVKILLTGISMGASTVLLAAGEELPENVVGLLADCGYTDAKSMIKRAAEMLKLPGGLTYPFARLGGRIFGGFDLNRAAPMDVISRCRLPLMIVHGEGDAFVPCSMSRTMFEAYQGPKVLFTVPKAGHGLSYLDDMEGYLQTYREFFNTTSVPVTLKGAEHDPF